MKVIVLSGFLGAGKTSLLLQLARYLTELTDSDLPQVAILENEIGKVSIDSATLGGQGLTYRELISGCVCCSIAGEFEDALTEIETTLAPKWLVVEATGLAYPDRLEKTIKETINSLETLSIMVLVDAARFLILDKVSPLPSGQVEYADTILLNKVDLVDDEKKEEVRGKLSELNGSARVFEIVATAPIPHSEFERMVNND